MATSDINVDELKWYHGIDRDIFTVLVLNLGRDIKESMRVVALWLFIEELGYPNIIRSMLSSADTIIDSLAKEAVLCLKAIENNESLTSNDVLATKRLLNIDISLIFCPHYTVSAVSKISEFVTDIGQKVFDDIVKQAAKHQKRLRDRREKIAAELGGQTSKERVLESNPNERTILVTFARGYPISETEIQDFFNMNLEEDAVESICVQKVSAPVQPMFARVVFKKHEIMEALFGGKDDEIDNEVTFKFWINGKHAKARRYLPSSE